MELLVSAKLAHSKFMEFHGTSRFSEIGALQVPWNSMEFHGTALVIEIGALLVPSNPMELLCVSEIGAAILSSMEFHGIVRVSEFGAIPWNLECANFAETRSSMEFHEFRMRQFRWHEKFHGNSVELVVRQFRWQVLFHGIPWNSMELWVPQFRWHEQFHGIPWNLKCAKFADTNNSMEFHGT